LKARVFQIVAVAFGGKGLIEWGSGVLDDLARVLIRSGATF
jgi:hypothetical protein